MQISKQHGWRLITGVVKERSPCNNAPMTNPITFNATIYAATVTKSCFDVLDSTYLTQFCGWLFCKDTTFKFCRHFNSGELFARHDDCARRNKFRFAFEILKFNRTQFKTVAKFCKTVVAATLILIPILVLFVFVSLLCSATNTSGTKIGIKNDVAAATALRNFATVLNWVLLPYYFIALFNGLKNVWIF